MRQFISSVEPDAKGCIVIKGKEFHYLRQVLRLEKGQVLDVRLPSGNLVTMSVSNTNATQMTLQYCAENLLIDNIENGVSATTLDKKNFLPIWLFQFIPKPQKMDIIVRQATEVGVSVILPIIGNRSQKTDCVNRMERWNRIIKEARQQSGSPISTEIIEPCTLTKAIDLWQSHKTEPACQIVFYEEEEGCKPLHYCVAKKQDNYICAAVVVGCEGGISPKEIEQLSLAGFLPIHFKTNILRVETAALYGLAALQTTLTEQNTWLLNEFTC
ncbi:MAG: 16S rRNA (uracil(1498)-N(3))-methyltransferase [Spirochaetaceae bacterium]|nr:16S rRNA (uracil(1498)-N(3))-methyltransferase [Spirochaetaceae bacterium]